MLDAAQWNDRTIGERHNFRQPRQPGSNPAAMLFRMRERLIGRGPGQVGRAERPLPDSHAENLAEHMT